MPLAFCRAPTAAVGTLATKPSSPSRASPRVPPAAVTAWRAASPASPVERTKTSTSCWVPVRTVEAGVAVPPMAGVTDSSMATATTRAATARNAQLVPAGLATASRAGAMGDIAGSVCIGSLPVVDVACSTEHTP